MKIRAQLSLRTTAFVLLALLSHGPSFALSEAKSDSPKVPPSPEAKAKTAAPSPPLPAEPAKELSEAELLALQKEKARKARLEQQAFDQADLYKALYNLKPDGWVGSALNIQILATTPAPTTTSNDAKDPSKNSPPQPKEGQVAQPSKESNEQTKQPDKAVPTPPPTTTPGQTEASSAAPQAMPAPSNFEREGLIIEFGGQEYAQRIFSRGQRRIYITIYKFASPDGAYGAYLALRQGSSTTIRQGDATSQDDRSVSFWKDLYFVSIVGTSEDDDESLALVTSFAKTLSPNIRTSSSEPFMLTRLPLMERVQGSEKIVMGQLAAHRVFAAPYLAALLKEKIVEGAVADYKMQYPDRERLRLLLAQFDSPEAANRAYAAYTAEVTAQHPPQPMDGYVPQASIFKVSGTFVLCQLRGNEVLLITGARKRGSLTTLARQVY